MNRQQVKAPWYDRVPLSIRAKMLIAFLGLTLVPILMMGHLAVSHTEKALKEQIVEELQIEVTTAASALEDYLQGVSRDVGSLARFLQRRFKEDMTRVEWLQVRREFFSTITAEKAYYQVRFIALDGMELLRVNNQDGVLSLVPEDQLQNKSSRYYVQEAFKMRAGEIYLSHLDFNIEFGEIEIPRRLVVRLAAPIIGSNGDPVGLVVINVFGEELLSSLEDLLTIAGMRVLLLNQGGKFIEMDYRNGKPHFVSAGANELTSFIPSSQILPMPDGNATVTSVDSDLLAIAPVNAGLNRLWYLSKIYPQQQLYAKLNQLKMTFVISAIILACLASGLAIIAARRFSRPIRKLSHFAEEISEGHLSRRVQISSNDELGQLSESLNEMALARKEARQMLIDWNESLQSEVERKLYDLEQSRLDADQVRLQMSVLEKQLLQANRLSALGMLSATVAHEIGNPLAGLKVKLQMLLRNSTLDEKVLSDIHKMLEMVDRLGTFLGQLTNYVATKPDSGRTQVDINKVVSDVGFILGEEASLKKISLNLHLYREHLLICSTSQYLHQIMMNLILNALQACSAGGLVEVFCEKDAETIIIRVCDNGCGLSGNDVKLYFEPLFTTKTDGTGLGLAIVSQLVSELKGTINMHNRSVGGVEVMIRFSDGGIGCKDEF